MRWLLTNLQAAVIVFLIGLASGSAGGAYIVKILWDLQKQAQMEETLSAMKHFASTIHDLEVKGEKDEETIRNFRRTHPPAGVHLPPVTCGGLAVPGGAGQTITRVEPLPNPAQQAFDNYAAGTGDDALEADLTVNDCRVVYEWAKSLKSPK